MTEAELIRQAHDLLLRPHQATAGLWPRASALLARQALEAGLKNYWSQRGWALQGCSFRAQLLCLDQLVDREVARQAAYAYDFLSNVCHFHPYNTSPTSVELRSALELVESVVERLKEDIR